MKKIKMTYEIKMPKMGETVLEATVLKFYKNIGDAVAQNETVADVATDKVDNEVLSEMAGIVVEILAAENGILPIGATLMVLEIADEKNIETPVLSDEKNAGIAIGDSDFIMEEKVQIADNQSLTKDVVALLKANAKGATPLARAVARELGIDLSLVETPNQRIMATDVYAEFHKKKDPSVSTPFWGIKVKPLPDFSKFGNVEHQKMTPLNRTVAENLQSAWSNIPHAWITEKVDISKIEALREQFTIKIDGKDRRMTLTVFIAKAVARVLQQPQFAIFNASLDIDNQTIIYKKYVNIGIAVDTERGLFVPVIKDCDRKGLSAISLELTELAARTRAKQNTSEDFESGNFSISNIGGIGGTGIFPIVNAPEVAILGVTAAHTEGGWNDDKKSFEPRPMLPITLGFDHRIINGAAAARFLVEVKKLLEEPFLMQMY